MAELNKEFIVNLKGKDFVQYGGLVDLAHQMELKSITTELVQLPNDDNKNQCIIKAVATTEDGKIFEGYGDAAPSNVNSMIAKHLIRMAETRAKARALRDLTNVGMTALEELGGEDEVGTPKCINSPGETSRQKDSRLDGVLATDKQLDFLYKLVKQKKYEDEIVKYIEKAYKKTSSKELTKTEASEIIEMLNNLGS